MSIFIFVLPQKVSYYLLLFVPHTDIFSFLSQKQIKEQRDLLGARSRERRREGGFADIEETRIEMCTLCPPAQELTFVDI